MSRVTAAARLVLLVTGVGYLAGCHTYQVMDDPPIGSMVRVRLPLTATISGLNRAPETVSIEGRLVESGDTMTLVTQTRRELGAYRELTSIDTIRLAASQTSSVELREFSTAKSVILGVAIAGAAGFAGAVAFGFGGGEAGDEIGDPGPQTSIVMNGSFLSALWGAITR